MINRRSAPAGDDSVRKERLGFVVLQHVNTLTVDAAGTLFPDHIASDLAIPLDETREILALLAEQGFVGWDGGTGRALVTRAGADYVLRIAGRRRSVRFQSINRTHSSSPASR